MKKTVNELLALARGQLIGRYKPAILAVLLVTAINLLISTVIDTVSSSSTIGYIVLLAIEIIVDLLFGVLILGECHFYLKLARFDESLSMKDLFYGFTSNMDKAVMVQIPFTVVSFISAMPAILINFGILTVSKENLVTVKLLLTFLPSLITFVVNLFLGMAFYILNDHPDYSPKDVLLKAYELMDKQKGRLFLAYLRLVPLYILGLFAFGVGVLWVIALQQTMIADFYLDLSGETPATAPKTPEPDYSDYSTSEMH